jgi:hypothetical protein
LKKNLWAISAVTAAAAVTATLLACGGGGDSGDGSPILPIAPAPEPAPHAPSPASETSSAPCTNEADFHAGTVRDYEDRTTISGQSPGVNRTIETTGERKSFAGANPVAVRVEPHDTANNPSTVAENYYDLVNGTVISYGSTAQVATQVITVTFEPPVAGPVDMQPGQVASGSYKIKYVAVSTADGSKVEREDPVSRDLTYLGREALQTEMGAFNTCRFTNKQTTGTGDASSVATITTWVAAEGPYRGQLLKIHTRWDSKPEQTTERIKMTYTPK